MAKPLKRPGAAPAPASTPAPAPAPAPAAAKPASKPAESKREEPKREAKPAKESKVPKGRVEALESEVEIEQAPSADAASQDLSPYLTALGRVEDLRRQGKIGAQVRKVSPERDVIEEEYRPALRPLKVTPKPSREPIARQPILRDVEMPTAEELDIRVVGARKMQEVMRNRGLTKAQQEENQMEIARLEDQLSTQRDQSTFDPEKSRAEQMRARAEQMGAISSQLKQLAAQQRGLTERLATQNATLREYGMTDEEIKSR